MHLSTIFFINATEKNIFPFKAGCILCITYTVMMDSIHIISVALEETYNLLWINKQTLKWNFLLTQTI